MWFLNIYVQYGLVWVSLFLLPFIIGNCIFNLVSNFLKRRKSLAGKVVVITGAGSGIGRELAIKFAKEKCAVICVDLNAPGNEETLKIIKTNTEAEASNVVTFTCDVTNKFFVNDLAEKILEQFDNVDILINNAGISNPGPLLQKTDFHIEKVLEVNMLAHFWTIRAFLPRMKERKSGMIVAISSTAAYVGVTNLVVYTASKHGVTGLMKGLYHELRIEKSPIKTVTIHPGFTATNLLPEQFRKPQREGILRIVSAEWMAKQIINAVKEEKRTVVIPSDQSISIYILEYILPEWLRHFLMQYLFDIRKYMEQQEAQLPQIA